MTTYPSSVSSSPALTDEATLQVALKSLLEFIPLETQGSYPLATLYYVLLWAASRHDTIEHTCQVLAGVPSGNGVRHHLNKLEQMLPLERQLNAALHQRLPEDIANHRHRLAIDLHLIPYYGTPTEQERLPVSVSSESGHHDLLCLCHGLCGSVSSTGHPGGPCHSSGGNAGSNPDDFAVPPDAVAGQGEAALPGPRVL